MKLGRLPASLFRFALPLAFFAIVAQLALGVTSAEHHARMAAGASGDWKEVCTSKGVERIALFERDAEPPPDEGHPLPMLGACLLCAAAGLGALPSPASVQPAPDIAHAAVQRPATAAPAITAALRPPVRAPPHLS